MKNVASLKSSKTDAPKTPGGISKSLLTPCRRVGLSRNWKKAGPSPFISPLSGNNSPNTHIKVENKETRKRKQSSPDPEIDNPSTPLVNHDVEIPCDSDNVVPVKKTSENITRTPRNALTRKKSKTLLNLLNTSIPESCTEHDIAEQKPNDVSDSDHTITERSESIVTPIRKKSKSRSKFKSPIKVTAKENIGNVTKTNNSDNKHLTESTKLNLQMSEDTDIDTNSTTKTPKKLTKECIIVIQKKIFKANQKKMEKIVPETQNSTPEKQTHEFDTHTGPTIKTMNNTTSQGLFDSDSDDVPLSSLNKNKNIVPSKVDLDIIEIDDDFATKKNKVKKLDKQTSIGGLKETRSKAKLTKSIKTPKTDAGFTLAQIHAEPSQTSFDDDDDFDLDNKRTILIRKTYDKVTKPLKAKSTGSITQRDVDELKARIEMKKKLLLAKACTEDTEELRTLIKKWTKGCQDALIELMDLMKHKFPDKKDMDYSEILQMLRIPAPLVGYDEDNDCFTTPDDSSIVLAKFNDV